MSSSINLSLTDELREFIDRNCGDGTLYATPSEFLRDLLREKKERMAAAEMRDVMLEGYRNLIEGRVVEFKGDLRATLSEVQRREKQAWYLTCSIRLSWRGCGTGPQAKSEECARSHGLGWASSQSTTRAENSAEKAGR